MFQKYELIYGCMSKNGLDIRIMIGLVGNEQYFPVFFITVISVPNEFNDRSSI